MYRPCTIEQYHVYQYLNEQFVLEACLVLPLSRSALMLEDRTGEKIAFQYKNCQVKEIPIPPPPDPKDVSRFLERFRSLNPRPKFTSLESMTRWWLDHPNPLTHQQALGLSDELYRHYLSHPLLDTEKAWALASKKLITEHEYRNLLLWYRDNLTEPCWLGQIGVDGTGNLYELILRYRRPDEARISFYLLDDYYREMNHIL